MKADRVKTAAADMERLQENLKSFTNTGLAVAFSGGLDSSVLLAVASKVLPGNVIAITAVSQAYPSVDKRSAERMVDLLGVEWIQVAVDVLSVPEVASNQRERCYHCKLQVFDTLIRTASKQGLQAVVDATNLSDLLEYRPGKKALEELGIRSPLVEAGLDKSAVRRLARYLELPVADMPATACLLTRLPYGTPIDKAILKRIDEAEDAIRNLGITLIRVRHHGDTARLEVALDDLDRVLAVRERIVSDLMRLGWSRVTLDLRGYESGSFDKDNRGPLHGEAGKDDGP